jgi:regulator of sigma E protease
MSALIEHAQTAIAFLVAIGLLVAVHESGHYWVARWCGVKVLRFSLGMGKVIYSRRLGADQTEWVISILPLGGYVKMLDGRDQDLTDLPEQELKREFTRQNVWRRIAIVAAGPAANFMLAIIILTGLYMAGIPEPSTKIRAVPENTVAYQAGLRGDEWITAVNGKPIRGWTELQWELTQAVFEKNPARLDVQHVNVDAPPCPTPALLLDTITLPLSSLTIKDLDSDFLGKLGIAISRPKAILGKIDPDGPAMRGGLKEGDVILKVNGKPILDALAFVELISSSAGQALTVSGRRGLAEFNLTVTPEAQLVNDKTIGRIKVALSSSPEWVTVRAQPIPAIGKATKKTWDSSVLTLKLFGKILTGDASWKNVTGPITIADYAGQTARIGPISYLNFLAFISISLGVINLLPIPVLDGGFLLYYSLEVLMGRPIPDRFKERAQPIGLALLMLLMAVAIFNDVIRLIS